MHARRPAFCFIVVRFIFVARVMDSQSPTKTPRVRRETDRNKVLAAVAQDGLALREACLALKADKEVPSLFIKSYGKKHVTFSLRQECAAALSEELRQKSGHILCSMIIVFSRVVLLINFICVA